MDPTATRPRGRPKKEKPDLKLLGSERLLITLFLEEALSAASSAHESSVAAVKAAPGEESFRNQLKYWANVGSAIAWLQSWVDRRHHWVPEYREFCARELSQGN